MFPWNNKKNSTTPPWLMAPTVLFQAAPSGASAQTIGNTIYIDPTKVNAGGFSGVLSHELGHYVTQENPSNLIQKAIQLNTRAGILTEFAASGFNWPQGQQSFFQELIPTGISNPGQNKFGTLAANILTPSLVPGKQSTSVSEFIGAQQSAFEQVLAEQNQPQSLPARLDRHEAARAQRTRVVPKTSASIHSSVRNTPRVI